MWRDDRGGVSGRGDYTNADALLTGVSVAADDALVLPYGVRNRVLAPGPPPFGRAPVLPASGLLGPVTIVAVDSP